MCVCIHTHTVEIHSSPCNHHLKQDFERFHSSKKFPPTSFQSIPYLPALQEATELNSMAS